MTRPDQAAQLTLVEAELTPAEVVELWAFVHGDIMEGGIREQLHRSLGLCARHTWGYAVVEIELWQTGAGVRGGHQPFDVSVLYEDLLDRVAAQLDRPAGLFHHDLRRALTTTTQCCICNMVKPATGATMSSTPMGYGGSTAVDLAAETNQLSYTRPWCDQTAPQWHDRVCPDCRAAFQAAAADQLEDDDRSPYVCRLHLLLRPLTPELGHTVAGQLRNIAYRLGRLSKSMTKDGPAATPEDDASWIEALGWFAGWQVPLALTETRL